MDNWKRICGILSQIFEANRSLNFGINLNPIEVESYLTEKVLFARLNSLNPAEIEAALFVTTDGECGFIASKASLSTYKTLIKEFNAFVVTLPEELQTKLWCKIQRNNHTVQKLLNRLGFVKQQESNTAYYYTYKGG